MATRKPTEKSLINRRKRYEESKDLIFVCPECEEEKTGAMFSFDSWRSSGRKKKCNACLSRRFKSSQKGKIAEIKTGLREKGCFLCPEKEPCCMHIHHINPESKDKGFAHVQTVAELERELAKGAIILCANCHAKVHSGVLILPEGVGIGRGV